MRVRGWGASEAESVCGSPRDWLTLRPHTSTDMAFRYSSQPKLVVLIFYLNLCEQVVTFLPQFYLV